MRTTRAAVLLTAVAAVLLAPSAAAGGGGGGCHSDALTDETTAAVDLRMACFAPTVARVEPGAELLFVNADPMPHTVTGAAGSWGTFDELLEGDRVAYRFDTPGVYPYFCVLHPSMVGAVVVGDGVPLADAAAGVVPASDGIAASDTVAAADTVFASTETTGPTPGPQRPAALVVGLAVLIPVAAAVLAVALGGAGRRRRAAI